MAEHSARVTAVTDVGEDTVALELEVDEPLEALPGQFVLLRADVDGDEEAGYYTISSPSVDTGFEVTVGVDPEGGLSKWLASREPGDTIQIEGPYGEIAYDDEGDVVTIAGGPGIGPAVAIAERASAHGHRAAVIYQDDAPAHKTRLDALSEDGQTIRVFGSDEGALESAVAENASNGTVYVFGFADFCTEAKQILESNGVAPEDAYVESFG
ncbi:FAD-binding oxidoreductase [Halobellus sp. GM3]|uniref:FAD-binding oxidoreductase n=1 Tax=Halobellus sp. GM3 TaxID=3458410 RepID=UPI00403DF11B